MKKVIRTIAAVAILFATTTVMAKAPKLGTDGISKSLVFEWETQLSEASLNIFDKNGTILYSDDIDTVSAYAKKFDLTALPEGAYFLKIKNGTKELVYSISVNRNSIAILGLEESFMPAYRKNEDLVYLNFLNHGMKVVDVEVTDSLGNVLFEETFKDSFVVEKAFNFEAAFEGNYTIAVRTGKKTYYENITVKN